MDKYLSRPELLAQNPNLNHLIEPSFQGVNRLFVLALENDGQRTSNKRYYLPEIQLLPYYYERKHNVKEIDMSRFINNELEISFNESGESDESDVEASDKRTDKQ